MAIVSARSIKKTKGKPESWFLIKCTCGRVRVTDRTDLMRVMEEVGVFYRNQNGSAIKQAGKNILVCMRFMCLGKIQSVHKRYMDLPIIAWDDYLTNKKEAIEDGPLDLTPFLLVPHKLGKIPTPLKCGYRRGETKESHARLVKKDKRRNASGHIKY